MNWGIYRPAKMHKRFGVVAAKCLAKSGTLRLSDFWEDVTCKNCLQKGPYAVKKENTEMASKLAKKLDQLYLSKAELKNGGEEGQLRLITKGITIAFEYACSAAFGLKWVKRLQNSAGRKNKSTIGYAIDVLLK